MLRRTLRLLLFALAALAGCRAPSSSPLELLGGGLEGFELRFEGNRSYDAGTLGRQARQSLVEFVERGFPKYAIDDAAYAIRLHYESEGFAAAEVDYELVREGREEPLVVFRVSEGPRTQIAELRFLGNSEFSGSDLSRLVVPERFELFGDDTPWFSRSRLEAGRGRLEGLYYERGYLRVAVVLEEVEFNGDRTQAIVTYRIDEGPQLLLRSVELEGLPAEWEGEAREGIARALGEPWFPRVGYELEARVEEVAANNGHPYASASSAREIGPDGAVSLAIAVELGERIWIGDVRVVGNEKTKTSFIRSRLELEPGQLYDRGDQRESFRNLYETGLFDRVTITLEGEEPGVRDVLVEVEEGATLQVYVEPGYGSYERWRLLAGITEKNLFGTGRTLTAEAAVAVLAQRALLRFTEPNVFGPRTYLDLEGFVGRREEPSFTREEVGAAVQLRTRLTRRVSTNLRYERSLSRAVDIQAEDPSIDLDEENVDLSVVSFTPAYDSRNAPFLATQGTLGRFTIQVSDPAIGSELGYLRLLGSVAQYFPLGERAAFAASLRTGVLIPTDDTESFPIQLRFFNGGENTVRSFKESQLGPKDSTGEPIGGEAYNVFSVEYRRMLFGRFQGAAFFDAGNVLPSSEDYGSFDDVRMGVGVGLRWILPIGPVRLDWGVNPDPEEGEEDWVLHFSLGTAY